MVDGWSITLQGGGKFNKNPISSSGGMHMTFVLKGSYNREKISNLAGILILDIPVPKWTSGQCVII